MTDGAISVLFTRDTNPTIETFEKIAAAFGKRVEDMLGDTSEVKYTPPPQREFGYEDAFKVVADHLSTYNDLWDEFEKLSSRVEKLESDLADVKYSTGMEDYPENSRD